MVEGFSSLILPFVFLKKLFWIHPHKRCPSPSLRFQPHYRGFIFQHLQTLIWFKVSYISTTYIYTTTCYHSNLTTYHYCALWMVGVFQETMIVFWCSSNPSIHANQFVTNSVTF
jgi:hypothetical protein